MKFFTSLKYPLGVAHFPRWSGWKMFGPTTHALEMFLIKQKAPIKYWSKKRVSGDI